MIKIIQGGKVDAAQLAKLFEASGFNRLNERGQDKIPEMLANSDNYFTCYESNEIVGFVRLLTDKVTIGYIFDLCVAPSNREKGIGKALMERVLEFCDSEGIPVTHLLDTSQHDNFYTRFGYKSEMAIKGMYRINPKFVKES